MYYDFIKKVVVIIPPNYFQETPLSFPPPALTSPGKRRCDRGIFFFSLKVFFVIAD